MARKWFKKYLPGPEEIAANRWLSWLGPALRRPELWQLHRRSVARAVAVGLFCGLMPGPTQMLSAGLLALWLRCNLPVALATTLYTNPFTIVPLYLLAYEYGKLLTGARGGEVVPAPELGPDGIWAWMEALGRWALSLGPSLAVGLVALALTLAVLGYLLTDWGWRWYVVQAWKKRVRERGSD
ncbi:MAG: DUF2062 domain-containing protein [Microvirgula sp.]